MTQKEKTIWVGMSGGVDSSVAALVLIQQGYNVIGATLKLRETGMQNDIEDARRVCESLGIEHRVIDFTHLFRQRVINCFTNEYLSGHTPNPCIVCNRTIKFGAFLDYALEHGAHAIATGHYARIDYDKELKQYILYRTDSAKDQSYVLYGLSQYQLAHTIFPLTGMEKDQVRAIAQTNNLPIASKSDSMEICFVPNSGHADFIEKYTEAPILPGNFVDEQGNILGQHKGITHYTIGQRKGLGISFGQPMYVVRINAKNNQVVLGVEGRQYASSLTAKDVNYISIAPPACPIRVQAKIRYQSKPADATLEPQQDSTVYVTFDEPQRSVTPGQAVVFYDGNRVLGGGTIV